jgi:hypothetical protein
LLRERSFERFHCTQVSFNLNDSSKGRVSDRPGEMMDFCQPVGVRPEAHALHYTAHEKPPPDVLPLVNRLFHSFSGRHGFWMPALMAGDKGCGAPLPYHFANYSIQDT